MTPINIILIILSIIVIIIAGVSFYIYYDQLTPVYMAIIVGAVISIIVGMIFRIISDNVVESFQEQSSLEQPIEDILKEVENITDETTRVNNVNNDPNAIAISIDLIDIPGEEAYPVQGESDKRRDLFGKKFRFKSIIKNKYFSLCDECNSTCKDTLCLKESPGPDSEFTFEPVPESDKVLVRSLSNNLYWTVCERCFVNCPYSICCNGVTIGYEPSQFDVVLGSDDEIYLKGSNGLYLKNVECANPCTVEPDDILACVGEEPDRYSLIILEKIK